MLALPDADLSLAIALLAAFVGGCVRGFTGFGTAMIMVPALSVLYSPVFAIPVVSLVDSIGTLPLVPAAVRRAAWREVLPLAIAASLAVPLGVWILLVVDETTMTRAIALSVIAMTAILLTGWRYRGAPVLPVTISAGAASGLMNGSVGMGGPPVLLFWLAGQTASPTVRANAILFFFLATLASWITFTANAMFTAQVIGLAALCLPVFGIGLFLGSHGFRRGGERHYRVAALTLIGLIGVAALITG
ncbi:MAG: sulfite exporter TauE/SafE family protein [Azospirillaceae bacterium]